MKNTSSTLTQNVGTMIIIMLTTKDQINKAWTKKWLKNVREKFREGAHFNPEMKVNETKSMPPSGNCDQCKQPI